MGSAPCNLFCCTKPSIALPKSDIFVPQINIDIIQNTKNLETNVVTSIIEKAPLNKFPANRQTTEKALQEKHKIRNSLTMGGRPKKVKISLVQENDNEKKNSDKNNVRYSLNDSKKEINYCEYEYANNPKKCLVTDCKTCKTGNNYFCSECESTKFEVNIATGQCVKKQKL